MNRLTERDEYGNADIIPFSETNPLTAALNKLAAYEDTGLSPEEIAAMKAEFSDTFQAHLQQLCDIKDKHISELQAVCKGLMDTIIEYQKFKEYFKGLYGRDLTVGNWHLNGALEPFDNFYDKAVGEMRRVSNGRDG